MNDYYFVSYSTKDSKVANQMVEHLEGKGVNCWIAPRNIAPGRDYTDCIDGAIRNSKGIILLYSKYSVVSEWVKKEVARGVSYHKKVIPYKISEAATDGGINFMLNNVQWIVSMDKPTEKFCEIESALSDSVQSPNVVGGDGGGKKKRTVWYIVGAVAVALVALLVWLFPKGEDSPEITVADTTVVAEQPRVDTVTVIVPMETPSPEKKKKEKQKTSKIETVATPPENVQETKKEETPVHEIGEKHNTDKGGGVLDTIKEKPNGETGSKTPEIDPLEKKYNMAISEFNKKRYSKALKLFKELRDKGAKYGGIESYIKQCEEQLK